MFYFVFFFVYSVAIWRRRNDASITRMRKLKTPLE